MALSDAQLQHHAREIEALYARGGFISLMHLDGEHWRYVRDLTLAEAMIPPTMIDGHRLHLCWKRHTHTARKCAQAGRRTSRASLQRKK